MKNNIYPGIPDSMFIRSSVPMTKEEVRVISVSKLRLEPASIVLDIGAGTGSVSIEIAKLIPDGMVYAVESEKKAVDLIKRNIKKFRIANIKVIKSIAPVIPDSISFDRVFVGGSGGRLLEILQWIDKRLPDAGRIVVNAITLETLNTAKDFFNSPGYNCDIVQVSIARCEKAGRSTMMRAENPVFVIAAEKKS
jgi:cobalt-precorrin-6B (C15)-methyltransferase